MTPQHFHTISPIFALVFVVYRGGCGRQLSGGCVVHVDVHGE